MEPLTDSTHAVKSERIEAVRRARHPLTRLVLRLLPGWMYRDIVAEMTAFIDIYDTHPDTPNPPTRRVFGELLAADFERDDVTVLTIAVPSFTQVSHWVTLRFHHLPAAPSSPDQADQ